MRLLFLDQFADLDGGQLCLLDLLPAVISRGWTAVVAAPEEGPLLKIARSLGADTAELPCGPYTRGRKNLADWCRFTSQFSQVTERIADLAVRARAALIYVNGPRLLPPASWAAGSRMSLLFHCHHRIPAGAAQWVTNWSLRRARVPALGCCQFVLEPLRAHAAWTQVIYNGAAAADRVTRRAEFRRIGVIGRICEQKGQHLFIEAARLMQRPVSFLIFGAPESHEYLERLKASARGLPLVFQGYQAHPVSMLDLLVVPSAADEATTRVIPEAWAAGVPVVAFSSGGIREIVAHGVNGFLIERRSAEDLAVTLDDLLSRREALHAVADQGYKTWRERFTLERYQAQVLQAIERAAGTDQRR